MKIRDLEWFADPDTGNGRLSYTHLDLIKSLPSIMVPDTITIEDHKEEDGGIVHYICYPLYQHPWMKELVLDSETTLDELNGYGWRAIMKPDFKRLLNEFIEIAEGPIERITNFVLRWGPLWFCGKHNSEHDLCLWTTSLWRRFSPHGRDCVWYPREKAESFRTEAARARAALMVAANLLQDREVSDFEVWVQLVDDPAIADGAVNSLSYKKNRLEFQCYLLFREIDAYLALPGGPIFSLDHKVEKNEIIAPLRDNPPRLSINTGLGFLRVVWLQIAQQLCDSTALFMCSGCGKAYIRILKRPRSGDRNYCDVCSETGARKRDWARENRLKPKPAE